MSSVRVRTVCGLAVMCAAAASALGQGGAVVVEADGPAVMAAPGGVTIKRAARESKIDRYARVLGLDETQKEVAKDLTTAYERSQAEASKKMQAAMKDAQADMDDGDHAAFQVKLNKAMKEHGAASKELTGQYLSDLRALLRADQEGNWPRLERLRRRESVLSGMNFGGASLGGSGVDLIPMVGRMEIPPESKAKVDELLGLYEVDIDRPLQERERNLEQDRETMGAVQQFTPETFKKQQERDRAVDLKVREVNDKYVRLIGAELPEGAAAKLADEYRMKSYRNAYRTTSVGRELSAAEKLKGLSEKQREQIKAMNERYRREARAANDRLAAVMRRAEDEGKSVGGPMGFGLDGGEGVDPQVADARSQRREVDSKMREEMEKLLTPDQLADARDAAKPQGLMGRQVSVIGDSMGGEMVFVSDIDLDEEIEGGEGGEAIMIIQTVETAVPATAPPAEEPK